MEQWKKIEGFENYSVSTHGRVRNDKTGYVIKSWEYRGYQFVRLHKKSLGGFKAKRVHRLVAEAFIPNTDKLPMVNHKDENKTNNHVSNLEWCTNEYNLNYGTRNQRISEKTRKRMLGNNIRGVSVIVDGVEYKSAAEAALKTGVTRHALYNKKETYKGHKITYIQ